MRKTLALGALLLTACGIEEAVFVPEYTSLWCDFRMQCDDEALLRFDGIATKDDCYERALPVIGNWGNGCLYDGRQAEVCLADLETTTCPAGETSISAPESCDDVYVECRPVSDDSPSGEDPQEEEDEDEDEDADEE